MNRKSISLVLSTIMLFSAAFAPIQASVNHNEAFAVENNANVKYVQFDENNWIMLKNEYLEIGGENIYKFTIPESGYYLMRTGGGEADTYGKVTATAKDGTVSSYENDDYDDENVNFCIKEYFEKGTECTLSVTGYKNYSLGEYRLVVVKCDD